MATSFGAIGPRALARRSRMPSSRAPAARLFAPPRSSSAARASPPSPPSSPSTRPGPGALYRTDRAVLLVGTALGWRLGALSMLLYVVAGVDRTSGLRRRARRPGPAAWIHRRVPRRLHRRGRPVGRLAQRGWDRSARARGADGGGRPLIYAIGVPVLALLAVSPGSAVRTARRLPALGRAQGGAAAGLLPPGLAPGRRPPSAPHASGVELERRCRRAAEQPDPHSTAQGSPARSGSVGQRRRARCRGRQIPVPRLTSAPTAVEKVSPGSQPAESLRPAFGGAAGSRSGSRGRPAR